MSQLKRLFIYRKRLIMPYVLRTLKVFDAACYLMSLIFIIALVYEHGFRISISERDMLHTLYGYTYVVFVCSMLLNLLFDFRERVRSSNILSWLTSSALIAILLPHLLGVYLTSPFWAALWRLLDSYPLLVVTLSLISLLQLSMGVVKLLSRHVNPAFILSVSFFLFIIIGTAMLMLPRATYEGISILDALFMSTSAVCVTGLATLDVATTFTPMGVLFILLLIQVGGLGVMTLTSFFAMFFMGNSSLNNQLVVSDMVSQKSLSSLLSTLLYILGFTFIIEVSGALLIFISIHGTMSMTLSEELSFAIFHSISAFCNAGFSTLSSNLGGQMLTGGYNLFYLAITALIVLGGIGFPVLVNIYTTIKYYIKGLYIKHIRGEQRQSRIVHLYDINTRIVLMMTLILLLGATVAIALLEWNGGFAAMSTGDKIIHSLFNAACPRTAGFSSVAISSFSVQTILLLVALMIIGGGAQSTAGGIKVNVFAVILLNLRAILMGRDDVSVFNRELSGDSIRRSNSTLLLYMIIISIALFVLTLCEREASLLALTFEAISALSTVGSSLDLTPTLSPEGKSVIIFLMFIGRVGVLTIAMSLIKQRRVRNYKYPSGNIIIN